MRTVIGYFLGTYEDWGGASRALLNFIRAIDKQRFRPIVFLTQRGALAEDLERRQIDHRVWGLHDRSPNVLAYSADIWRAANLFRRHKIGLLHINYSAIGWKPAEILAARLLGIPVINHLHISHRYTSSFVRYSSVVLAVSQYVADHSDSWNVPKEVVHNVADIERFGHGTDLRQELGYDNQDVLVSFLGQMIRAKGLEMFVEMAKRIHNPRVKFLVAGPLRESKGAYTETEVRDIVSQDPRISYLGYRTDAQNLYATADIVCMPSQWEEPCAMVLFEAAAAGRPVVATATGGTPEVLRHGETGFLVARDDVAGMTSYVEQLISDQALRHRLGDRAREVATNELAVAPVRRLEQIYDDVVGSNVK